MKLYEVIFSGTHDDGTDLIYLVSAPDFRAALEEVQFNASPSRHEGERFPLAHVVFEIGDDLSPHAEARPGILRGPYFGPAYNRGWRAWRRTIKGSDFTKDWLEEIPGTEPSASPNGGPAEPHGSSIAGGEPPSVS